MREKITLWTMRGMSVELAERFRLGAASRGLTQAAYLERLLELHDAARSADRITSVRQALKDLSLE